MLRTIGGTRMVALPRRAVVARRVGLAVRRRRRDAASDGCGCAQFFFVFISATIFITANNYAILFEPPHALFLVRIVAITVLTIFRNAFVTPITERNVSHSLFGHDLFHANCIA